MIEFFYKKTRTETEEYPNSLLSNPAPSAKRISTSGFTMIETLVAITILLLAIAGPLTIAAQSLYSARVTKDRLTATYLAQEGIELVRQFRATNILQGNAWMNGLGDCISGDCFISSTLFVGSCSGDCPFMFYNENTGYYHYNSGAGHPESPFVRTIHIEEILPNREAIVSSSVTWSSGRRSHTVLISENILNW